MPEDFLHMQDEELIRVLTQSQIATPASARAAAAIGVLMLRLSPRLNELNGAVMRLDESSSKLVSETNRLTFRILWLTVAAVVLTLLGVSIGVLQLLKN